MNENNGGNVQDASNKMSNLTEMLKIKTNISNDLAKTRSDNVNKKNYKAFARNNSRTTVNKLAITNKILPKPYHRNINKQIDKPNMKVIFLGGLNQIGKNITLFEFGDDIVMLDCGSAFPDGEMLGIDLVIPDFSYIKSNAERIRGLVITHGHEDHIGAVPYLLSKVNIPIYGTALTVGLLSSKLKEHRLSGVAKLNVVYPGQTINLGSMSVEFIHVNHSIPDAVGVAITSPAGTIVHTGDFKIDCTPSRGPMIDLARFSEIGKKGVLALMADSTNAERPGYTMTEKKINESFEKLFHRAGDRRIVIATFASNIGRIQQIINCAAKCKRKVAFSGRSMINYIAISKQLNYIEAPDDIIIDIELITKYSNGEVVLVTTGSQGEPMSALHRMAFSEHRKVSVGPEDFIIVSATPIPGNEKTVGNVINSLMKLGCEVIYESMYEVHVSGHACQEELKIIHGLTKPKYFIPVHGEYKHLKKHAEIAENMGMESSRIYVGDSGDVLEIGESVMKKVGQVPAEPVFVDGIGVGDVGSIVLRDRKHLGQDGLIVVVATLDSSDKHIIAGPDIVSRGFVYVRESERLMNEARYVAIKSVESCSMQKLRDWTTIKTKIRDDLYKLFHNRTRRNPVILPIIMEV
ncbi:MAG: ribonuclease J [Oscillospiraceae bacterium]|jgi:ribonuclease J|nr:ribonuclease J [Oscillospiraceae bacterium]